MDDQRSDDSEVEVDYLGELEREKNAFYGVLMMVGGCLEFFFTLSQLPSLILVPLMILERIGLPLRFLTILYFADLVFSPIVVVMGWNRWSRYRSTN